MILLVDEYRENRTIRLRDALRTRGIPCICVRGDFVRDYPEALCAFVFTTSEHRLNTVSLRCGKLPLLCVNESGSRIYNKDVIFFDPKIHDSYESFVVDFIESRLEVTLPNITTGKFSICDGIVSYGLNRVRLTRSEGMILSLLALCKGKWICEKNILRICFDNSSNSGRVPVHVCNINNKARKAFGRKLICSKRGIGYTFAEGI